MVGPGGSRAAGKPVVHTRAEGVRLRAWAPSGEGRGPTGSRSPPVPVPAAGPRGRRGGRRAEEGQARPCSLPPSLAVLAGASGSRCGSSVTPGVRRFQLPRWAQCRPLTALLVFHAAPREPFRR